MSLASTKICESKFRFPRQVSPPALLRAWNLGKIKSPLTHDYLCRAGFPVSIRNFSSVQGVGRRPPAGRAARPALRQRVLTLWNPVCCRVFGGMLVHQYMPPPMPAAGAAGSGWGMSVTRDSVVRTMAATEVAFCRAERVTLVGSVMPRSSMSVYSSLAAS